MSQDQSTPPPISVLEQMQTAQYLSQAGNTLFVFEWIITLGQEINIIWKRRCSLGTVLFALTRYATLALNSQLIWGFLPVITSKKSCRGTIIVLLALSLVQYLCFAIFTAFRAYSLLQGTDIKFLLSGIICALSLMPFAANIFSYSTSTIEYIAETSTCTTTIGTSPNLLLRLSLATRICASLADVLVLSVTWYKTANIYRTGRKHGVDSPLITLLLRDGALYFAVLLLINILTVLVDNIPLLSNLLISNPLQESIAPILICRFMMNLRDISSNERTSEHGRTWSSIHFVGNMGQTLRAPGEEEDEEWDDELSRDQEERQEGSSSPSAIQSGPSDREVGAEALQTTSRPQSVEGVVNEGI